MSHRRMTLKLAVEAINRQGMLLVFPIKNQKEPASLWSSFFPRSEMRWEWDQDGDTRVSDLWRLREELSQSGQVVYAKWFRGRATFISRALFPALVRSLNPHAGAFGKHPGLSVPSLRLLQILEGDSPLSTKALKLAAGLKGRAHEREYTHALKELWERLRVVGYGEVDDGAFPSLAIGAASVLFEDLWKKAQTLSVAEAESCIQQTLQAKGSFFLKFHQKLKAARSPQGMTGIATRSTPLPYISFTE